MIYTKDYISYKLLSAIKMINENIYSDFVLLYSTILTGDDLMGLLKKLKILFSEVGLHIYSKTIENFLLAPII